MESAGHDHLAEHHVVAEEGLVARADREDAVERGAGLAHPDAGQRRVSGFARRRGAADGGAHPVALALPGVGGELHPAGALAVDGLPVDRAPRHVVAPERREDGLGLRTIAPERGHQGHLRVVEARRHQPEQGRTSDPICDER